LTLNRLDRVSSVTHANRFVFVNGRIAFEEWSISRMPNQSKYPANQLATASMSVCNCLKLKPDAKSLSLASGGRMAYTSSTHSSHQGQVACCVFPQVSTVTPFWSYATA